MLALDFERDVYVPGLVDESSEVRLLSPGHRVLSGTLRPGLVAQLQEHEDVVVWGELSSVPGGIDLMADWLRKEIRGSGVVLQCSISMPESRPEGL